MVANREKEKWPFDSRLGHVRISSDDLLELLGRTVPDFDVSASSKRHVFTSLEDIQENLALFSGDLEISIKSTPDRFTYRNINLRLGHCATIGTFSPDQEISILMEKISTELKHHRTPILGYLTIVHQFYWTLGFLFLVWFTPASGAPFPLLISWLSERLNAGLWIGCMALTLVALAVSFIPPVYYNPRLTFWQRNRDAIIVGSIMLFVGFAANRLFTFASGFGAQ